MPPVRPLTRATLVAAIALAASGARAQELNPQAFPVGEEALGLAGAYTGRSADASASYYDPGGLVFGRSGSVSASLSIGLYDRYQLDGATADGFALDYDDALGVPFYVGASIQLGHENPDGSHEHALAASAFSPSNGQRHFVFDEGADGGPVRTLSIRRRDRTRFYGVSYALRVLDELGIGLSAFFAIRSFVHEETEIVSDTALSTRHSWATLDAEALVFRLGAQWRVERHVSLGLMFQPPGIEVGARATVASVRATGGPPGVDTGFSLDEKIGARSPVPWQVRLGGAWTPLASVLITADVSVVGPMGSASEPIERFALNGAVPEGALGRYLATRYWTEWTVDGAIGGRVIVEDVVPISAGFFTSFSSAPPIADGPTSTYQPDRLDLFGASLSAGYRGDSYDFAIGVVGTLGFGRGLRAAPLSGLEPPAYVPAALSSQAIYLFVTGAGGAVRAVTRELAREVFGTETEDHEEPDRDAP